MATRRHSLNQNYLAWLFVCSLFIELAASQTSFFLRHSFVEEQPSGAKLADLRHLLQLQGGRRGDANLDRCEFQPLDIREKYFFVDSKTGEIFAKARIDRESLCEEAVTCCKGINPDCKLPMTIGMVDPTRSGPAFQEILQVDLDVLDLNDNAPRWTSPTLLLEISEHTLVGSKFKLPPADDPDKAPDNTTQIYRLASGTDLFRVVPVFSPDPAVSVVLLLEVLVDLDRETKPFHTIVIHAVDGGPVPLTGSVTVNVSLTDINDNPPFFTHESRTVSIPENYPLEKELFRVTASDRDASDIENLHYRFSLSASKAVLDDFRVDRRSGSIVAVRPLDYESKREYSIPVTVSDGKHLVETTIEVRLLNINDNPPTITVKSILPEQQPSASGAQSSDLFIRENAPIGTLIASVDVKDADDKAMQETVTCFIEPSRLFGMLPLYEAARHQFKIVSNVPFDRELKSMHQATVTCHDNGSPNRDASVQNRIRVIDENDHPPTFRERIVEAQLHENAETSMTKPVIRMEAGDKDEGVNAAIRYSLDTQSEHAFYIDTLTGAIYPKFSFDREKISQVNITVFAKDMGDSSDTELQFTATGTVVVNIQDVNDCDPVFQQRHYSFAVVENVPNRTFVGKVRATDCDAEERHRSIVYRLIRQPGDPSQLFPFEVSPDGSVYTSTDNLDREARHSYSLRVLADDQADRSDTATMSIAVLDLNDNAPRWVYPGGTAPRVNISMHKSVGDTVYKLHASDPDEGNNGTVVYSLVSVQPYDSLFVVSRAGDLTLGRSIVFNRDVNLLHNLVFNACDQGSPRQLFSVKSMSIFITEQAPNNYGLGSPKTSEGNLIIIVAMVVITLVVSIVLIAAIFFLRCNFCDRRTHSTERQNGRVKGSGHLQQEQQEQQLQLQHLHHNPPAYRISPANCDTYQWDGSAATGSTLAVRAADCEAGDPHHYQVALTLSPMESDQTIGRSYLPVADSRSESTARGPSSP
ncbi:hypothetical protein BOX15_Mlig021969g1 [Macrostomum lignano]|uniref:Cadherin domain-containing protein n=1 Tax=Macrostomum lignano TaxID=282301 RepID=A0A267DUI6_9PLAT|nr:hypothetical protein BOX15_Mlig021969g1 [Macrostomum lignano]